jgi:arsenate reductase-like glutaredoxin family protein
MKIDWYYHRKNCQTCARADAFLEEAEATIAEQVDARKTRLGPEEAVALAREASHVWATKGKKVIHFDMKKSPPTDTELTAALIGPSGNLRAPTFRRGKQLFVGMNEEEFGKVLG